MIGADGSATGNSKPIAQALHTTPGAPAETAYLHQLTSQVDRALERNRVLAQDVAAAHVQLQRIADGLRYPPRLAAQREQPHFPATSQQVRDDMERLLKEFKPDVKCQPAQATLVHAWQRVWATCRPDLLPCYDIPGLPPDNLQLAAFFGQLRRAQRRISGRKSTAALRDFGQYRTLVTANNEAELLQQIRQVSLEDYAIHRRRLQEAEAPRKLLYRLHRAPLKTMQTLVNQHTARRTELASNLAANLP